MDTQKAIGLSLIFLLLTVYMHFFPPRSATVQPSEMTAQGAVPSHGKVSIAHKHLSQAVIDHPMPVTEEQASVYTMANDCLEVTFSTLGGGVKKVWLKKYKTYLQDPLILLDHQSSQMGLSLSMPMQTLHTRMQDFQVEGAGVMTDVHGNQVLTFVLPLSFGGCLSHIFTLKPKGYMLDYTVKMTPGAQVSVSKIQFDWDYHAKRLEKNIEESRGKATLQYDCQKDGFQSLSATAKDRQEKSLEHVSWVSHKQKFFSAAVLSSNGFTKGVVSTTPTGGDVVIKKSRVVLDLAIQNLSTEGARLSFYFGPNDYRIMKGVAKNFDKNVYLGWPVIKWFNQGVIMPIFDFLTKFITNYGVLIVVLVLIIKLILLPLSYKSYIAMSKMKSLKPALDDIKKKYAGNMQQVQVAQMQLYREMGINPLSGCIPVFLQVPVLFALFHFFPNAIAFRQQAFLWANDLSTYDSIGTLPFTIPFYGNHVSLFTILMTISTILYTWSNNQVSAAQGPMKTVSYMMPVMFMFVLNSFPASLSFYYFVSNMVTFLQQFLIKRFVNEEKIKEKLEDHRRMYRGQSHRKTNFKKMLENAMKASAGGKKMKK